MKHGIVGPTAMAFFLVCLSACGRSTQIYRSTAPEGSSDPDWPTQGRIESNNKPISNPGDVSVSPQDQMTKPQISLSTETSGEYVGGGRVGDYEETWQSPAGTTSRFRMEGSPDNGKGRPQGLMIYLHGDGAGDYSWFWSKLKRIASKNSLMPVSVLAPTKNSWYVSANSHTEYLDSLIRRNIYTKYNINKARVVFSGASGGPQFLTGQFIPLYGNYYSLGGAVPMCGGGGPKGYGRWVRAFKPSEEFRKNFRLFYVTGTQDFLYDQVVDSANYYRSLGVSVRTEHPTGIAHCKFDLGSALERSLSFVLEGR